jgi:hypothetical protein
MPRVVATLLFCGLLALSPGGPAEAQQPPVPPPIPPGQAPPPPPPVPIAQDIAGRVKVFIDCSGFWGCDFDYFREHLSYVDHVRDRAVADVHLLITAQNTGAGGQEATLAFIGRGAFDRVNDELRTSWPPNSTDDAIRQALIGKIKLGLTRYVAHSEPADSLRITAGAAAARTPAGPTRDPWNHWVFRLRFNGNMNGESSTSYESFSGGLSANRVTEAWKTSISGSAAYRESSYDLGDDEPYVSISRDSSLNVLQVKSLTAHWSLGVRGSIGSSTYTNKALYLSAAPAIEYNLFPYAESTRRALVFQYAVGVASNQYRELTIYDKTSETQATHSFLVDVEARQPWGQVSASVDFSQFLTQLDNYRVQSFGMVELRLKKGLSLNVGGGGSWIRDQIYLPKGDATTEEILVRQRQLATSYSYSVYFGVSYTFGSIFNNIVNPRFSSSSGGGGMIMYY